MSMMKYVILFFALLFVTGLLAIMLPMMIKDKPTDAFYYFENSTTNWSTGAVEPIVKGGAGYSSSALLIIAILFFMAILYFMSRKKH